MAFDANDFQKYFTGHLGGSSHTLHDYQQHLNDRMPFMPNNLTPNIIEERQLNVVAMDVFSRLMMDRIIFLGQAVTDVVSNIVVAQLLYLDNANPTKDIQMFINSPGGSVYAGLGMYDVMNFVKPDVSTTCTGMAASMGAVLLTAGTKGKRFALPHSRVMIHQPSGGAQGQASDIEIVAQEILKTKAELYQIMADATGQTPEQIEKDSDRDKWMRATEAKDYGLIDDVIAQTRKSDKK